jgi:hypothetical protein
VPKPNTEKEEIEEEAEFEIDVDDVTDLRVPAATVPARRPLATWPGGSTHRAVFFPRHKAR